MGSNKPYFTNLDPLRFFLASLVVVYHIPDISRSMELPFFKEWPVLQKGTDAVLWFFVLSGFLLSHIAKKEVAQNKFSIRKFFARRILRIWPVYFLVILIGITLYYFLLPLLNIPFTNHASLGTTLLLSLFFLTNILQRYYDPGGVLLVTWSVSVEEQFYLFFPILVTLFFKKTKPRILSSSILLCLVIMLGLLFPKNPLAYFEIYVELFLIGILASEALNYFNGLSSRVKHVFFLLAISILVCSFFTNYFNFFTGVTENVFKGILAAFVVLVLATAQIQIKPVS